MNQFSQRVDAAMEYLLSERNPNAYCFTQCRRIEKENGVPVHFWPESRKDEEIIVLAHRGSDPWGMHRHDYFVFNCVYAGAFMATVNGRQCRLNKGDICILQPYAAHHLTPCQDTEPGILVSVAAKTEFMRHYFLSMISDSPVFLKFFINCMDNGEAARAIEFTQGYAGAVRHLLREMIVETAEREESYGKLLEGYFANIIILLSRCYDAQHEEPESERRITVEPIMKYIAGHFDTITLAQTAEHFNYNPNYLSNVLRKEMGCSFNGLVKRFKIERACQLLAQTDMPVSLVASMAGYAHLGNFHKVFKASTGLTPNEYRKRKMEEKPGDL